MIILVDSREKVEFAYEFAGHDTERVVLPHGDYSIKGYAGRQRNIEFPEYPGILVERKSIPDFVGSVGKFKRLEARFEAFQIFDYHMIIVEGTEEAVKAWKPPIEHCNWDGALAMRKVAKWKVKYPDIKIVFVADAKAAEKLTLRFLRGYWNTLD